MRYRDAPDWAGWQKTTLVILTHIHPILDKKFRWIYISEIVQEDLSLTVLHATVTNARKLALWMKWPFISTSKW